MNRGKSGPKRSTSVQSSLWQTRGLAIVAALALIAGVVSGVSAAQYWNRHALIASLASSFIVVMLTVAVFNEVAEWRSRRRWSVLAQYVMIQLVRSARMVWMAIAGAAVILRVAPDFTASIDAGASAVRDTQLLRTSVGALVGDTSRRRELQELIARLAEHSGDAVGRWASVMLNTAAYAELIDRHVELASSLAWLQALLDNLEPPEEETRRRSAEAHPAGQIDLGLDDELLIERLVVIVQLAEHLDSSTLQLAEQLVPREWWTRPYDRGSGHEMREPPTCPFTGRA